MPHAPQPGRKTKLIAHFASPLWRHVTPRFLPKPALPVARAATPTGLPPLSVKCPSGPCLHVVELGKTIKAPLVVRIGRELGGKGAPFARKKRPPAQLVCPFPRRSPSISVPTTTPPPPPMPHCPAISRCPASTVFAAPAGRDGFLGRLPASCPPLPPPTRAPCRLLFAARRARIISVSGSVVGGGDGTCLGALAERERRALENETSEKPERRRRSPGCWVSRRGLLRFALPG